MTQLDTDEDGAVGVDIEVGVGVGIDIGDIDTQIYALIHPSAGTKAPRILSNAVGLW